MSAQLSAARYASLANLRILIVDDIPAMRSALRRLVEELDGARIDLMANGEEAIAQMATVSYDVVLCDYNLGDGKDGQQVLEEVRRRNLLGVSAVFLLVTAEVERPMVLGALEYQPEDYLVKPIQRDVAMRRLSRAVNRKRDMKALDEAIAARDHGRAIVICEQQAQQNPAQLHDFMRIKAELCIVIGDYGQAEMMFKQALAEREFPWAKFGLGRIAMLRDQPDIAQRLLEELIANNRHFIEAYDWLATALEAQGRHVDAQEVLQAALELSPKSVRRQRRLGNIATHNEEKSLAERAYRCAIREGRGSCYAGANEFLNLAELMEERHSSKGLAVLREGRLSLRAFPDEEIRVAVGQVFNYVRNKLPKDAARFLDQAFMILERCSKDLPAESVLEITRACFMTGRNPQGIDLIRRALRDSYDDPVVVEATQALIKEFNVDIDCAQLVTEARSEVMRLNNMGVKLFEQAKEDEAARLLMAAADSLPRNRTINMNAVKTLLNLMMRNGPNEKYLKSVAKYLDRLCQLGDRSEQFRQVQRAYRDLIKV